MNAHVNIERTPDGYQFNGLAVTGLAPRESQVLLLRAAGLNINECSRVLNCGVQAVKARTSNLLYKLHATNATDMVIKAIKSGHLRVLMLLIAAHLSLIAPTADTRDAIHRTGRTRPRTMQRYTRVLRSDGLFWVPDTATPA